MAGMSTAAALLISSAVSAATSLTSTAVQGYQQNKARHAQEDAQAKAEQAQTEADRKAETQRLEGLAKNQEGGNAFDFGVDSALAKRYRDAAQKWGAGTGEMSQKEEEENPFYTRGLF